VKSDSCLMPFHTIQKSALTAGIAFLNANPAGLSSRATVEADAWAEFRVTRLSFRLHPESSTASSSGQAVGYIGGIQDTTPSTVAQVGELIPSTYIGADATVPSEWVHVSRQDLSGPFPWYKTVAGTTDTPEELPGQIYVCGNTTDAYCIEIRGVFEFKVAVATANTPLAIAARKQLREERALAARARERTALLSLLAPTPSKTTG